MPEFPIVPYDNEKNESPNYEEFLTLQADLIQLIADFNTKTKVFETIDEQPNKNIFPELTEVDLHPNNLDWSKGLN